MRTRNKTTYTTIPSATAKSYYLGSPYTTWFASPGGDVENLVESMSDEKNAAFGRYHPCEHKKFEGVVVPVGLTASWQADYENRIDPYGPFLMCRSALGLGPWEASLPPVDWESYSGEAYQAMYPIQSDLSLVNALLELKDLKRLPDFWSRRRRQIANIGNAHLNVEFGWKPLISDVRSLATAIYNVDQRFSALLANANRPLTRHWSRVIQPGSSSVDVSHAHLGGSFYGYRMYRTHDVRYYATMKYSYRVPPEAKRISNRVKFMLDTLGVRPDASIVWNAIPYSFALDWVTNVGSWLGSLSSYNLALDLVIEDFCHSVKVIEEQTAVAYSAKPPYLSRDEVVAWSGKAVRYVRRPASPLRHLNLRGRGPSWKSVTLSAALLSTRT